MTAEIIPIPNEFHDDNAFWPHPIYDKYEVNRMGVIRHIKHKKPLGNPNSRSYLKISINDNGKRKKIIIIFLFMNAFMIKLLIRE